MQEMQKTADYFQYEYQDMREVRANQLLNHYIRELELDQLFNQGFCDAEIVSEEMKNEFELWNYNVSEDC